jgi:hypothetical protein
VIGITIPGKRTVFFRPIPVKAQGYPPIMWFLILVYEMMGMNSFSSTTLTGINISSNI